MPKYPCYVCSGNCKDQCIYCETCHTWSHYRCQDIDEDDRHVWRNKIQLSYICIRCRTNHDDSFDYLMALERLRQASEKGSRKLTKAAEREVLFLKNVPLEKDHHTDFRSHQQDPVANTLVSNFHFSDKTALHSTPDGDCLFHSISLLLNGDESRTTELRYRCCIDMAINKSKIMLHPQYKRLAVLGITIEQDSIMCARTGINSSMLMFLSMSRILNMTIDVILPMVNGSSNYNCKVMNTSLRPPFADPETGPLTVMWTTLTLLSQPPTEENPWAPNHVVPMVNGVQREGVQSMTSYFAQLDWGKNYRQSSVQTNNRFQCLHETKEQEHSSCTGPQKTSNRKAAPKTKSRTAPQKIQQETPKSHPAPPNRQKRERKATTDSNIYETKEQEHSNCTGPQKTSNRKAAPKTKSSTAPQKIQQETSKSHPAPPNRQKRKRKATTDSNIYETKEQEHSNCTGPQETSNRKAAPKTKSSTAPPTIQQETPKSHPAPPNRQKLKRKATTDSYIYEYIAAPFVPTGMTETPGAFPQKDVDGENESSNPLCDSATCESETEYLNDSQFDPPNTNTPKSSTTPPTIQQETPKSHPAPPNRQKRKRKATTDSYIYEYMAAPFVPTGMTETPRAFPQKYVDAENNSCDPLCDSATCESETEYLNDSQFDPGRASTPRDNTHNFDCTPENISTTTPEVTYKSNIGHSPGTDTQTSNDSLFMYDDSTHNECELDFPAPETVRPLNKLHTTTEAYHLIKNKVAVLPEVPSGNKSNCFMLVSNDVNTEKVNSNEKCTYFDDCGVWDFKKGNTLKSMHLIEGEELKCIDFKNSQFCVKRRVQGKVVWKALDPQPNEEDVVCMHRYYATLKRAPGFKKRVTFFLSKVDVNITRTALYEYQGQQPVQSEPHGNAINGNTFVRTNPKTVEKIKEKIKHQKPKEIFQQMRKDDSSTCPRDFRVIKNVKQNSKDTGMTQKNGNIADEILEVLKMINTHPFVQNINHQKEKVPSIICYTKEQITDLRHFLKTDQNAPVGIDRTFNLGSFYVTVIVYKNNRVLRKDTNTNPIFIGPILLHKDASYQTYKFFLEHVATALDGEIKELEMRISDHLIFGSDDEKAMTKAIEHVFPGAKRFLCTKHLKDNVKFYLQNNIGMDQAKRKQIMGDIFGPQGLVNADSTIQFEEITSKICNDIVDDRKLTNYFQDKLKPRLQKYVFQPTRDNENRNWTNNNAESINNILKLSIDWRPRRLQDLIEKIHSVVRLHYMDYRSALHGHGNYHLAPREKAYFVPDAIWRCKNIEAKEDFFSKFLADTKRKKKVTFISTTNGEYTVPYKAAGTAKKPGQRKRPRTERSEKR